MSIFNIIAEPLSDAAKLEIQALHDKAAELHSMIEAAQDGDTSRLKSLAITALEESMMWAVKYIATKAI